MNPSLPWFSWSSLRGQWDGSGKIFAVLYKNTVLGPPEGWRGSCPGIQEPLGSSGLAPLHSRWLSCLEGPGGGVSRVSEEPGPSPTNTTSSNTAVL